MKIGITSYSLHRAVQSGEMDLLGAMQWAKDNGAEHFEIASLLEDNEQLVEDIIAKSKELDLELSSYTIGGNAVWPDNESYRKEIDRLKKNIDIAAKLGVKRMRHDLVAWWDIATTTMPYFEKECGKIIEAAKELADYAAQYGITNSIENHGYFNNGSDRVIKIVDAVNKPNFGLTLDVGNFMCVDEESLTCVRKCIPYASMIHLKDFYLRRWPKEITEFYKTEQVGNFFTTRNGDIVRAAIVGQGDIKMPEVIKVIKDSGYDSYISIEFEGSEECKFGTKTGMNIARKLWELA